jgi:dephospho-CoA kinase
MSRLTVGLTGGLASGKSTLAGWLAEAGLLVVDADRLVAEFYQPGGPGARVVGDLFGPEMLADDGSVDRPRLARQVFSDGIARTRLERAIHPLVRDHFQRVATEHDGIAVLEATLLIEAGMASDFDLLVTVEAKSETRVERAIRRGLSAEEAEARVAAQGTDLMRRGGADIVIENDGNLEDFRRQAEGLIGHLQELAEQP